jgi:phosphate transport system permease protein
MNVVYAIPAVVLKRRLTLVKLVSVIIMILSLAALVIGGLSLSLNTLEAYPVPLMLLLGLSLIFLFYLVRYSSRKVGWKILVVALLVIVSVIFLRILPEYYQGLGINGIIHRSFFSALLLLAFSVPAMSISLNNYYGNTPRANDISSYPMFVIPILLALVVYGMIIFHIIAEGAPHLNWSLLFKPFIYQSTVSEVWRDGWPYFESSIVSQAGMRNHILGTFLLIGLTSAISLPVGVGTGIFIHQYAGKKVAYIINFTTTSLRSISGIILAITAINLLRSVHTGEGTTIGYILHGFGYSIEGMIMEGRSSYLFVSFFISLLVIPLIAKATEEGFNSLPRDIWEGSLSVGASIEHTLIHILLPWSLPNIITGLVLGCAEAAGSLSIIFLICGTGEFGVGPLNETTSLAYLIFDCKYGKELGDQVQNIMGEYQFTAALLLLIITMGLTVTALVLKSRLSRRYKEI